MFITVIVPSYRRPQDLNRCLEALKTQTRAPDEVLVIVRNTDTETWEFLRDFNPDSLPLCPVKVTISGQVAALNAGLEKASGDIISITDDDAAPHSQWLAKIEQHFLSDDKIGGVGGRDWVYINGKLLDGAKKDVGKVQWFGRVIGNHHLGTGDCREVDILKGANMSYRRSAICDKKFDGRLKGNGSQINNDMAFSLCLRKEGWKLIYDPDVAVDHYGSQRFDEDQRDKFSGVATTNQVHNETLALLDYFSPIRGFLFLTWGILIGNRVYRGLLQCLRFIPKEGILSIEKCLASLHGRWLGWQTWINSSS
jgi:glycosyltransferase involved in cell wall biosynthesis